MGGRRCNVGRNVLQYGGNNVNWGYLFFLWGYFVYGGLDVCKHLISDRVSINLVYMGGGLYFCILLS